MRRRPAVYGLDIETDTTENGLDPRVAAVVTVALVGPSCEEVFTGPEHLLLADLDERLRQIEPGVLATWNGAAFDLPFIADRAALYGMSLGLRLQLDASITMRRAPLPGHRGAYRASWYRHDHLDAYRLYRGDVGPALRISCSLKSIARFVGLAPIEVDRSRIHDLSNEALHAYAASDARLARILTERRWGTASRCIDRIDVHVDPRRAQRALTAVELDGPHAISA
ncbi:MAG: 3'-5' exonuclease [Acidimicrobiales bacterium]